VQGLSGCISVTSATQPEDSYSSSQGLQAKQASGAERPSVVIFAHFTLTPIEAMLDNPLSFADSLDSEAARPRIHWTEAATRARGHVCDRGPQQDCAVTSVESRSSAVSFQRWSIERMKRSRALDI